MESLRDIMGLGAETGGRGKFGVRHTEFRCILPSK